VANDTVIFEVRAEGKNLKIVRKDVDAVADGVERTDRARKKAGKGQDNYNKREKAIYQSGLSSAKGFSKMNQTIGGGSSGLVGAYATLAANVFAATAAFNALSSAARFTQLEKGLNAVGAAAGRNLSFAAQKLVEVSGHAISTEQAMRSMALGISSGFSTDQMEGLTKVAKGASLALGRDMADAMDRLTRGAAKLEPEILDELGIMVRLDDATEEYATTLGKSADQLTQFERRQAFLNAILVQGESKFGQLAESIDPNPYDKLAASLDNLAKTGLNFLNKFITPLVQGLASSQGALIGTLLLFVSTIARQLVPGLANMARGMADNAAASAELAKEQTKNLNVSTKMPKVYRETVKGLDDGNMSAKEYSKSMNSLNGSIRGYTNSVAINSDEVTGNIEKHREAKTSLQDTKRARSDLVKTMLKQNVAQAQETQANAVAIGQQRGMRAGLEANATAYREMQSSQKLAAKGGSKTAKMFGGIRAAAFGASGAIKVVGSRILGLLGPIGMFLSIGMLVWDMVKDKFIEAKPVEEEANKIKEALESIHETAKAFNETIAREGGLNASAAVAGYKALGGVLLDVQSHVISLETKAAQTNATNAKSINAQIVAAKQAQYEFKAVETIKMNPFDPDEIGRTVDAAGKTMSDYRNKVVDLQNELQDKEKQTNAQRLEGIKGTFATAVTNIAANPAFAKFGSGPLKALEAIKNRIGGTGKDALNSIEEINAEMIKVLTPIQAINDSFNTASSAVSNFNQSLNKLANKDQTPFDDVIKNADVLKDKWENFQKAKTEIKLDGDGQEAVDKMEDELKKMLGVDKLPLLDDEGIKDYVKKLNGIRDIMLKNRHEVDLLNQKLKKSGKILKQAGTVSALKRELAVREQIRLKQIEGIQNQIDGHYTAQGIATSQDLATARRLKQEEKVKEILEAQAAEADNIVGFTTQITKLEEAKVGPMERAAMLEKQRVEFAQKLLDANTKLLTAQKQQLANRRQISELDIQMQKAQNRGRARRQGIDLSPADQLKEFHKFAAERLRVAREEHRITVLRIELEEKLLAAKTALLKAEIKALMKQSESHTEAMEYMAILSDIKDLPSKMSEVFGAQKDAADSTLTAAEKSLKIEREKLRLANLKTLIGKGTGAGKDNVPNTREFVDSMVETMEAAQASGLDTFIEKRTKALKKLGTMDDESIGKKVTEEFQADDFNPLAHLTTADKLVALIMPIKEAFGQLGKIEGPMQPTIQALEGLSTGLMTSISTAGDLMSAPWMEHVADAAAGAEGADGGTATLGDKLAAAWEMGGFQEKTAMVAAGVGVVTSAMTGVFDAMHASTQQSITGLDYQIAQVKKLYGGTKKGEKMIAALEVKKEAQKRKAFKQQKAMMLAQAMSGIAMGIVNAINAGMQFGLAAPVMVPLLAGMVATIGAAQMAIIGSMSYQGGGTAPSGAGASISKVSVGSSSKKVDVAGSNAGGELHYMRGGRGIGSSASDFSRRGAFVGSRYRATGGAAYVVGEQGPELFVPETPGQIVASDDIEAAGAPINATFNIQTIDATNMEETLIAQRGNIIGMIREAANNQGQQFLEGLDTMALGDSY